MKRKKIWMPLAALTVLLAASCAKESVDVAKSSGKLTLELTLPQVFGRATEPGEDGLNENEITTLDLFIYQDGEDACAHYQRIVPHTGMASYGITKPKSDFEQDAPYVTYVVANGETLTESGVGLTALKALATAAELDPDAVQTTFLMDGKSAAAVLNDGTTANGSIAVELRRVAAKIRVNLLYGAGFEPDAPVTKQLVNYASNAAVLQESAVTPSLATMAGFTAADAVSGEADQIVLYSYPNDWSASAGRETYVYINVPVGGVDNFYKIPVNYRRAGGGDATNLYNIRRNHLYDVTAVINRPGGDAPAGAVELDAVNHEIIDWSTREVAVSIYNVNYLFVKDRTITMNSTSKDAATERFSTSFQSSNAPVAVKSGTLKVYSLDDSGETEIANPGVTVTPEAGVNNGTVDIYSPTPLNFVPRIIRFTLTNGSDQTEKSVEVTQYPPLWIGHIASTSNPGMLMHTVNVMMAELTTIPQPDTPSRGYWGTSNRSDFIYGYYHTLTGKAFNPNQTPGLGANGTPPVPIPYSPSQIGYPRVGATGTDPSGENSLMISPAFILASQPPSATLYTQVGSRPVCSFYSETGEEVTYMAGGWRLPTRSEMILLDVLQNIQACEIRNLSRAHRYWIATEAFDGAYRVLNPEGAPGGSNATNAEVRCMYDLGRPM